MPHYEVFEGADGEFYWRLVADNGEIVAASEGYETADGAEEGARTAARDSEESDPDVRRVEG